MEDASDDEQDDGGGDEEVLHDNAIDMFRGGNCAIFVGDVNTTASEEFVQPPDKILRHMRLNITTIPEDHRSDDWGEDVRDDATIWKQSDDPNVAHPSATDAKANIQLPDAEREVQYANLANVVDRHNGVLLCEFAEVRGTFGCTSILCRLAEKNAQRQLEAISENMAPCPAQDQYGRLASTASMKRASLRRLPIMLGCDDALWSRRD